MGDVTFRYANDRPPIALVGASAQADAGQLATIRRALEAQGFGVVPATAEGKQILQINGFRDKGQLTALLMTQHFAQGSPHFQPEPGDHPTRSWHEWLEDTSLKACGWGNVVGDVSLLVSGLMSGRGQEAMSGLLYTAGGAVLARYGNTKTEYHLREVSARLGDFLREHEGELPEDCGLFQVMKERKEGTLPNTERFLARYPSQTTIGIYTLGAAAMLQSGIRHGKGWDIFYGANSTIAGAASILVPEKKHKQGEERPTGLAGAVDWLREKPLRAAGYAYIVSDIALALSAYREYRHDPKQRSYIFKFLSAGTYLVSSALMAISNKEHTNADGKFDADEQRRIEALAAETIAAQPKELRAPLINQVAGFLATQPEMQGSASDISKGIAQQVEFMEKNPWACHTYAGERVMLR